MKAALAKLAKAVGRFLARRSVRHVAVISAVFGLVIGGGVYAAHHSAGLSQMFGLSKVPVVETAVRSDNLTGSAGLKDDDPVKNFTRTGVGHVLFATSSTNSCKRTLFDNKTGAYREVADLNCGSGADQGDEMKSEQLNSMRRAFKR